MNLLLVSATLFEIRPLIEHLQLIKIQTEQLSSYTFKNVRVDVLIPGVGMVATAYHLGRQLAVNHYDLSINAGIAGTFNDSINLGDVVNVVEDCVPELGAETDEGMISVFELGLTDPDASPYNHGKLHNLVPENEFLHNHPVIYPLPKVKGLTSNTVHGTVKGIENIRKLTQVDIETMEGAAFFYSCLSENVPCLQIRAISNRVEERDKSQWKLNLALKNLNDFLWKFTTSIAGQR